MTRGMKIVCGFTALLTVALLTVSCGAEMEEKSMGAIPSGYKAYWRVHSVIGHRQPECPCCPGGHLGDSVAIRELQEPCCSCERLFTSPDGREWKTYYERSDAEKFERVEFFWASVARPDTTCPCCPIGMMFSAQADSLPCCVCAVHSTGGKQVVRELIPTPIPADLGELMSATIHCPVPGQIFVAATCDIERDPASGDPLAVELALGSGMKPDRGQGGTWTIPPASAKTGRTQTVMLRGSFPATAGEMKVSLYGKSNGPGAQDRAATRSLDLTFVPALDAGPLTSR